jgi:DNA-binding MarR family transcriptional regulator
VTELDAKMPDAALSKTRLRLWLRLLKASRLVEEEVRRRLRDDHATTLPRFDVMSALHRHPDGLRMSEISTLLRVSNGNITGIVDRLTEEGLAERTVDVDDRRAYLVRLTPRGRQLFARWATDHEAWIDELLSRLDGDDIEAMSLLLERVGDGPPRT